MPRKFDLDDGNVVLIVGSGAGGGTLGNELVQKGIRTVILEAGPRIRRAAASALSQATSNQPSTDTDTDTD